MAIYQLRYYADIVAAVREELQVQSTDTTALNRIKRDINIVYTELRGKKRWSWLKGTANVQLPAYVSTGSASVTGGSATVTLSSAPTASKAGYFFAVDGYSEIYRIESHTAGATTLSLDEAYTGATNATATYKIWTDSIGLPSEARETVEVWHDHHRKGLDNCGQQEWRRFVTTAPRAEGKPTHYHTEDFADAAPTAAITSLPATASRSSVGVIRTIVFASGLPAAITAKLDLGEQLKWRISGAGAPAYNGDISVAGYSTTTATNDTIQYVGKGDLYETSTADTSVSVTALSHDSDFSRQRLLRVHPSLSTSRLTLHVDYIKDVAPLENDYDEPLMPVEERSVLLYGVLHRAWSRLRNPEEATRNLSLYRDMLVEMEGRLQDGFDKPKLKPSNMYLRAKRNGGRGSMGSFGGGAPGGGSAHAVVSGTANAVAIYNASGEIDSHASVSSTELTYIEGLTSAAQTQLDAITTLANGSIYVGNASNVATEVAVSGDISLSNAGVAAIAAGVVVDADIAAAAAVAHSKMAALTVSRALVSDASGVTSVSATTAAEIVYVSGVTSAIQTQLDTKATTAALTAHEADTTAIHGITDTAALATKAGVETLTNKTIDADANTITNIENADIKASAAIAVSKLAAVTASRALVSDGSGFVSPATTTSTEIGYVNGVTSAIQTQLDAKATASSTTTFTNKTFDADGTGNTITNIENADIKAGAAIARNKLATGTAYGVVVNDSSGVLTSVAPSTANNVLKSNGTQWTSGILSAPNLTVQTKTTTYTILSTDDLVFASGSAFTLTLPDASTNTGKQLRIRKTDSAVANIITLARAGSDTIEDTSSVTSTTLNTIGETLVLVASGTAWQVIERKIPSVTVVYTPTGAWNTGVTYTGFWRRVGDSMEIEALITGTGATNAATASVLIPTGYTIDTAKILSTSNYANLGHVGIRDSNPGNTVGGLVIYASTTSVNFIVSQSGSSTLLTGVTATAPNTWAINDTLYARFRVPITGWNG